jgi:hypothetical protein
MQNQLGTFAHVRVFNIISNAKKNFLNAKQMHAMMMTTHFIYLTSMGCYIIAGTLKKSIYFKDYKAFNVYLPIPSKVINE